MKTFEDCKTEVARKHKLGNTLVTGHKATYFQEAAELFAESQVQDYRGLFQSAKKGVSEARNLIKKIHYNASYKLSPEDYRPVYLPYELFDEVENFLKGD